VTTGIAGHPPTELDPAPRSGPILLLWMALVVALQGGLWASGARTTALAVAVETGAARIETRGIGEVGDEVIRKAIRLQRDALPFWTTLALLGDFVGEPLALAGRAVAVAVVMSSWAALAGRPVRFGHALAECSAAQGFWVLGLAVRVVLMVALRRSDVETSLVLALPRGRIRPRPGSPCARPMPSRCWVGRPWPSAAGAGGRSTSRRRRSPAPCWRWERRRCASARPWCSRPGCA
jgi:hypothetical protein